MLLQVAYITEAQINQAKKLETLSNSMETKRKYIDKVPNVKKLNNKKDIDVELLNIMVIPRDLVGSYCSKDTLVQLGSHALSLYDDLTYDDWVYIGKAGCWI